jgi:hypothetical protein
VLWFVVCACWCEFAICIGVWVCVGLSLLMFAGLYDVCGRGCLCGCVKVVWIYVLYVGVVVCVDVLMF